MDCWDSDELRLLYSPIWCILSRALLLFIYTYIYYRISNYYLLFRNTQQQSTLIPTKIPELPLSPHQHIHIHKLADINFIIFISPPTTYKHSCSLRLHCRLSGLPRRPVSPFDCQAPGCIWGSHRIRIRGYHLYYSGFSPAGSLSLCWLGTASATCTPTPRPTGNLHHSKITWFILPLDQANLQRRNQPARILNLTA